MKLPEGLLQSVTVFATNSPKDKLNSCGNAGNTPEPDHPDRLSCLGLKKIGLSARTNDTGNA
jgi:hypothetical protein